MGHKPKIVKLGTYICEVKREDEKDGNSHFVNSCWLYWLASCMV
jgi:hypothetical protein